ncbi:MAG: hypothetical protein WA948_07895 [Pontixanthobacter sp.]
MTYAPIILVLLSILLLRSVKKDGLSAPARKSRKTVALVLGVVAVVLAVVVAFDDVIDTGDRDVPTLTGDRQR